MIIQFSGKKLICRIGSGICRAATALAIVIFIYISQAQAELSYQEQGIGPEIVSAKRVATDDIEIDSSWFVDPVKGSDKQNGSFSEPWKSIRHSIAQLAPGDTLYLRAGTYNESQIKVEVSGLPDNPITIKAYPGESAVIDGSLMEFRETTSADWKLLDSDLELYESVHNVRPDRSFLATFEYEGLTERLLTYYLAPSRGAAGLGDIRSNEMHVSDKPRYAGPGIFNSGGRLLLRLSQPAKVSGIKSPKIPVGENRLDTLKISLTSKNALFKISGKHLNFENIQLSGAFHAFAMASGSSHITFKDIAVSSVATGFYADGPVESILVDRVTMDGGFPEWIAWADMKGSSKHSKPASHWLMKASGFSGKNFRKLIVRNSRFINVFDGGVIGGTDIRIHNNFIESVDDMVQLATNSSQIEIDHNLVVGPGPSHNGRSESPDPGTKYIHHNIIDSTKKVLWSRADQKKILNSNQRGVMSTIPFPRHNLSAAGAGDPWKLYNNTIAFDSTGFSTHPGYQLWGQVNTTGVLHEVYNNIFLDRGKGIFKRKVTPDQPQQRYDGNLYWAEKAKGNFSLYKDLIVADDEPIDLTLSEFQELQSNSEGLFEEGVFETEIDWDMNSKAAPPGLDDKLLPQNGIPAHKGVQLPDSWPKSGGRYVGAVDS